MHGKKNKSKLIIILLFLCIGTAIYSGWKLISIETEYSKSTKYYDELQTNVSDLLNNDNDDIMEEDTVHDDIPTKDVVVQKEEIEKPSIIWPEVDFEKLTNINSDIIGWIYEEGTVINYPVVQGKDNSYYLSRMFDKTKSKSGTPFLDVRCSSDFSDRHSILYGHHMKNGSMFASLLNYKEQEYYNIHPNLLLITPKHKYVIELFSAYVCSVKEDAWKVEFTDDQEYESWIQACKEKSVFQSEVNPTSDSRIITLSTCAYDFQNARFVVMGILKEY